MVERGGEPRLAREALAEGLVLAQLWREQLERDRALERDVLRPVDDAHPPVPEQGVEAITREFVADTRDPVHVAHEEGVPVLTAAGFEYQSGRPEDACPKERLGRRFLPPIEARLCT